MNIMTLTKMMIMMTMRWWEKLSALTLDPHLLVLGVDIIIIIIMSRIVIMTTTKMMIMMTMSMLRQVEWTICYWSTAHHNYYEESSLRMTIMTQTKMIIIMIVMMMIIVLVLITMMLNQAECTTITCPSSSPWQWAYWRRINQLQATLSTQMY